MAITPKCSKCKKELIEYGAILLSPPDNNKVEKFHICKECYQKLLDEIKK